MAKITFKSSKSNNINKLNIKQNKYKKRFKICAIFLIINIILNLSLIF